MPQPAKILLVDDDADVRAQFRAALRHAGYEVGECCDGVAALEWLETKGASLIILDVDMPRLDGWKTLAELRRRQCTQPILMVTHVNDVDSRVHGLEIGADDYVGKPCSAPELLARVKALLRRPPAASPSLPPLRFGDVVVNLDDKTALRGDVPVGLTRTEFVLLELLRQNLGKPVSREQIIERVWGGRQGNSHTLNTHVWRLRQKLGDSGDEPRWIRNISGIGYVMSTDVLAND